MAEKDTRELSVQGVKRLPYYLKYLKELEASNTPYVPAAAIADSLGIYEVQVRKDLAAVSSSGGRPKIGYVLDTLILDVEKYLGYARTHQAVLVGVGHLGGALLAYPGFAAYGVEILAAFDHSRTLIGSRIAGKPILDVANISQWCRNHRIEIGVLTVPASAAQSACDALIAGGVRGIWNFAPTHLRVPRGILVQSEDMAIPLAMLSKHLEQPEYE